MSSEFWIDGFGPVPLERPTSVEEVGRLVREAVAKNRAVYPVGGRTSLHLGNPPRKNGIAISLAALNRVIDYPARDMTITVQAGITIARLREVLALEKQRLPIDVPQADKATLGGTLATNTSGPRRYGYGTLRDYVLGMSVVNDEGQEVKSGGRVVKNVAGYDLPKLFIGSLGTLGIITQVTLKLRPSPEQQALVMLRCKEEKISELLDVISESRTRPVCLDLLNGSAARSIPRQQSSDTSWMVVVAYEGQAQTVFWQVNELVKELKGAGPMDVRFGAPTSPVYEALTEFSNQPTATLTLKANMLSHAVPGFAANVQGFGGDPLLHSHAGNGIVRGHFAGGLPLSEASNVLNDWRAAASEWGGHVVIERCPSEWKKDLSVWGPPPRDIKLMKAVKERFDPRSVFNPGRFLDSI